MAKRRSSQQESAALPPAESPCERELRAALEDAQIKDRKGGSGMLIVMIPLRELVALPGILRGMAATIEANLASNDG